jgi:hypothetical protein
MRALPVKFEPIVLILKSVAPNKFLACNVSDIALSKKSCRNDAAINANRLDSDCASTNFSVLTENINLVSGEKLSVEFNLTDQLKKSFSTFAPLTFPSI